MKFIAVYFQDGGCDYTIGCGTVVKELPAKIKTYDQALEWLRNEDEGVGYYGRDRIDNVTLYSIERKYDIGTPDQLFAERDADEAKKEAEAAKTARQKQYEALKKEFGS